MAIQHQPIYQPFRGNPFHSNLILQSPHALATFPQSSLPSVVFHSHPEDLTASKPGTDKKTPGPDVSKRLSQAGTAAAFLGAAILLKKLPPSAIGPHAIIPADWKVWAKAALGVGAINQLNGALKWKPPVWLNALGTVAVIHPLIADVSTRAASLTSARKLLVLAPMVAGLVQLSSSASKYTEKLLDEKTNVPPIASKLAFSAGMIAVGLFALPPLLKTMTRHNWLGREAKAELLAVEKRIKESANKLKPVALETTEKVSAMVCARGCCASAVCVSEIGEFASATWAWLTNKPKNQTMTENPKT